MLHKHHIVPLHAGGSNDSSNLKLLSIEDHAEAHRIRYEQFGKREDFLAYNGLLGLMSKKDILKELCSHKGSDNPNFGKRGLLNSQFGKKRPEHSAKMRFVMKGKKKSKTHQENWNASFRNRAAINPVASKLWQITSPNGEVTQLRNMAKFCKEMGLNRGHVSTVAKSGKIYKGYKFKKLV